MVDGSLDNDAGLQHQPPLSPAPTRDDADAPALTPAPTALVSVALDDERPTITITAPDLAPTITPTDQLPSELLLAAQGKADAPEKAAYTFGRAELKGALLVALYEQGTVSSAARKVGLSHSTVRNWRDRDAAFDAAIIQVDEECIQRVERALYRDALAGDTTAKIFYLKGKRPKVWHDRARLEVSGPGGGPVPVQVDDAERQQLLETARQLREAKGSTEASE